jgi:hypothetical protein
MTDTPVKPPLIPTASSSTSVIVPPPVVYPTTVYDNYVSLKFFIGGIVVLLFAINFLLSSHERITNFFEKRKNGSKQLTQPLEARVVLLEAAIKTFKSGEELDREFGRVKEKIDHERGNRQGSQEQLLSQITSVDKKHSDFARMVDDRFAEERQSRTRLEAKVEALGANGVRVEASLERLGERFDERFDRFQELLLKSNKLPH